MYTRTYRAKHHLYIVLRVAAAKPFASTTTTISRCFLAKHAFPLHKRSKDLLYSILPVLLN